MVNEIQESQWEYLLDPCFELSNSAGKPLTNGWIEVYIAGSNDKYYCASDFSGTLHPFQIPLDSLGSNIVLASPDNSYNIYVYNQYGSLIMSRYNVKCHGGGSGSSTYVGDKLYYGQFKATDVATQAGLTRVTGNIDVDDGKLELKQGMSYHITLRGDFVVNDVSNVDTVLSYIEYSAVKPINVNVDYTKDGSQYFEISYDIYRLAEDMDYPVSFMQSNGMVKNLVVEVHSLSNLATSASGEGSEYEPGWGIVIQNNVISVDSSIFNDYATHEEVIAAVSGITGVGPGEVYNAGDYISIEDNTISVTGINPDEYATHDEVINAVTSISLDEYATHEEVYNSSVTAINLVTGMIPTEQVQSDWDQEDENEPDYIKNKPHIPSIELDSGDQVTAIDGHTLAGTGGSEYNEGFGIDIRNGEISIDTNIVALASAIPPAQVQSDWEQSDDSEPDYIKNKPDLSVYVTHDELNGVTGIIQQEIDNIDLSDYSTHTEVYNATVTAVQVATGAIPEMPEEEEVEFEEINLDDYALVSAIPDVSNFTTHAEVYEATVTAIDYVTGIIPEAQVQSDWNQNDDSKPDYIKNKPSIPSVDGLATVEQVSAVSGYLQNEINNIPGQVQSDWGQTDNTQVDFIKNKPTEYDLVAGHNVSISVSGTNVVISSTGGSGGGGTYTEGLGIDITNDVISLDNPVQLIAGDNVSISVSGVSAVISAQGGGGSTYTAGDYISIQNDTIAVTGINPYQNLIIPYGSSDYTTYNLYEYVWRFSPNQNQNLMVAVPFASLPNEIKSKLGAFQQPVFAMYSHCSYDANGVESYFFEAPITAPSYANSNVNSQAFILQVKASNAGSGVIAWSTSCTELADANNGDVVWVNLTYSSNTWTGDKTIGELNQAHQAGKLILLKYNEPQSQDSAAHTITSSYGRVYVPTRLTNSTVYSNSWQATYLKSVYNYYMEQTVATNYYNHVLEMNGGNDSSYCTFTVRQDIQIAKESDIPTIELDSNNQVTAIDGHALAGGGSGSSYTAGTGIDITNDVISVDNTVALKTDIPELPDEEEVEFEEINLNNYALASAIPTVELNGDNQVTAIDGHTLAGGGATYTEGFGIDISNNEISIDPSIVALASADPNIFFAHVKATDTNYSSTTEYTPYADVKAAYDAGKIIYCVLHTPLNWIYAVLPLVSASNMTAESSGYLTLTFTVYSPETWKSIYVVTYDGWMQTVQLRTYPSQADWNQQFSNYPGYIKNKPSIPEIELNSDNQVTAIDGHTLAGGSGGSSYTAGTGIDITNDVISVDNTVALKTDIPELPDEEVVEFETLDLSNYALASAIPDVSTLATKTELGAVETKVETVSGMITPELPVVAGTGIGITETETEITIAVTGNYALASAIPDTSDMATKTWVSNQGYLTEIPNTYATDIEVYNATVTAINIATGVIPDTEDVTFEEVELSDYALASAIPDVSDMATQTWVGNQGYLTSVPSNYVTETELTSAVSGFATKSELNGKQNTLTGITDVQVVNSLPGSPVATVLYLIPEV